MRLRHHIAILAAAAACLVSTTASAQGTDYRTFSLYIENDAFVSSDTGYTNGLRLSWSLARSGGVTRFFANAGLPMLLHATRIERLLGLEMKSVRTDPCQPGDTRSDKQGGRCLLLDLGIGQTMYTPDSLIDLNLDPRDRPYAGFLFFSVGGTSIDAPRSRNPSSPFVMAQLSNALILGVTGHPSFARETQSLAHWTWANGAARPLGWHNQLETSVQGALVSELYLRPRGLELCNLKALGKRRCTGGVDERRVLDFTPRAEVVFGTYMRRTTLGGVIRGGARFPDFVNIARIPTTRGRRGSVVVDCLKKIVPEPYWWYAFIAADARYVAHNMFIEGGYADDGPNGWKAQNRIDPRKRINELAGGFSFGNSHMTATLQRVNRSPEYNVDGVRNEGHHGYVSITFSMHTRPGTH